MSHKAAAPSSATLDEVAQEAGVSSSTVSRYITGRVKVSAERGARIEAAISRLNYHPNSAARTLANGRSASVGVLTQDIASPFYGEALRGIEQALVRTGYAPLIVSGELDLKDETACLDLLLARQVEGLIVIMGRRLQSSQLNAYAAHVPLVSIGQHVTGKHALSLEVDNESAAFELTNHLIGLGHQRIAFIGAPPDHQDARERHRGYLRALGEAGLAPEPALQIPGDFHETSGHLAVRQLIETRTPFTALFAANDQSAFGARLELHRRGLRVPQDVSLVGFDDIPAARYATPPMTTVHQPMREIGHTAGLALLALLQGSPLCMLPPPPLRIVLRESSGPAPQQAVGG